MFEQIPTYLGDPILSLVDEFDKDPRLDKVNLSIGYYYDSDGLIPELTSVKKALIEINQSPSRPSTYLPMAGHLNYRLAVQSLLFGEQSKARQDDRIATIQTIGGSGALHIGAAFLHQYYPDSEVWVSNPTWGNHIAIFKNLGFKVNAYPYYDAQTQKLDFESMLKAIAQLPAQSIVLLHPCCHNPTGMDLAVSQWDQLLALLKQNDLIPFMDIAYQGLGQGIEEDTYPIRALERFKLSGLVANSFSKNCSLYGERVGALSILCDSSTICTNVLGQLESLVRVNYSTPALFGAKIIEHILNSKQLKEIWFAEVEQMRNRLSVMRKELVQQLRTINPALNVDHILIGNGLFCMTGLSPEQIKNIKIESAIYLVSNGRMCIAGLTSKNIERVAQAIAPYLT